MNDDAAMMTMGIDEMVQVVDGTMVTGTQKHDNATVVATSVTDDSRQVRPGCVFVAIRGERVDGHDFVALAAKAGAVAAVVEHEMPDVGIPQIVVDNSVQSLGALARHNIDRRRALGTDFSIIGITGSVGKTTTKDLLHTLLDELGPTVAPVGSFNNDIGLPLTALQVNEHTRFLIAEMGANHVGEIANLTTIAPPDVAVVLKVGTAHLGEFGSVERIAQAKSEIVRGLLSHGVTVLNADDDHVAAMENLAPGEVLWFGVKQDAAREQGLVAKDISTDALDHPTFVIRERMHDAGSSTEGIPVHLAIAGRHNVYNALAAATVAHRFGMPLKRIAAVLHGVAMISPHRMAVSNIARHGAVFTLIDDSFNANPDSMKAGLDALVAWKGDHAAGYYRVAVLGAMLELGDEELDLHRSIGEYAARLGVDVVIAVGSDADAHLDSLAHGLAQGAEQQSPRASDDGHGSVHWVHDVTAAERLVDDLAREHPHTVVLLKGSHASGLGKLAERLAEDSSPEAI